jgi:hypothetical protein
MTEDQYRHAEHDLVGRMQLIMERETGHVEPIVLSGGSSDDDSMDDPIVRSFSTERERAKDEYRIYCNVVKPRRHAPQSYIGTTLKLGTIEMGKVGT